MFSRLATKIIDGDGYIMEDNLGNHCLHGSPLSGNRRNEKVDLSAAGSSPRRARSGNAASARSAAWPGPRGLARLSRRRGNRMDGAHPTTACVDGKIVRLDTKTRW